MSKKRNFLFSTQNSAAITRRSVCKLAVVAGLGTAVPAFGQAADRARPQAGDQLVFDGGELDGQTVTTQLLPLNAQPLAAFPRDPSTGVVRNGNRLNRVMVMRIDEQLLDKVTLANAAQGVIAYSAVCTHTGCDVFNWKADALHMACPCHESEFAVREGGKVVGGPAPRPLPMLPLTAENGEIRVGDGFTSRVGFQEQF